MRVCNRLQGMFVVGKHHLQPGEAVILTEEELAELHPMVRANLSAMMEAMSAPPAETLVPGPILPPVPVSEPEPAKEESKVEAPAAPVAEEPKAVEVQGFEAPVVEEPKVDTMKADEEAELAAMIAAEAAEQAAKTTTAEEPAVEQPKVEAPVKQTTQKSGKR